GRGHADRPHLAGLPRRPLLALSRGHDARVPAPHRQPPDRHQAPPQGGEGGVGGRGEASEHSITANKPSPALREREASAASRVRVRPLRYSARRCAERAICVALTRLALLGTLSRNAGEGLILSRLLRFTPPCR